MTWRFSNPTAHNVTLANPDETAREFGAAARRVGATRAALSVPRTSAGSSYVQTLYTPGTYKIFCYLHQIKMTQVITVRP